MKTGTYNHEHVAESFQGQLYPSGAKRLSGDAVRKKREYLQRNYPQLYDSAQETARDLSS
jgi:hypothetical protein